jgi:hypothetical protein
MQFTSTFVAAVAFLSTAASATNIIQFVQQDSTTRTVYFTSSPGSANIPALTIGAYGVSNQTFPEGWTGNWYAIKAGQANIPGMLGEIAWNAWGGNTFFDISAIVNPSDSSNVKIMYPKESKKPLSGCQTFPCSNAYNLPDDIQTLSTKETTIVCLLGNKASQAASVTETVRRHARHFVGHSA